MNSVVTRYYVVRVRPFESSRIRALRKMPKAYLWDWSEVASPGPRFENLVAMHLLKLCHYLEDREGHRVELRYLRDRAGREVDFIVTHDRHPWFAVEAKLADTAIDPALLYFRDRLRIPFVYQVVRHGTRDARAGGRPVRPRGRVLVCGDLTGELPPRFQRQQPEEAALREVSCRSCK